MLKCRELITTALAPVWQFYYDARDSFSKYLSKILPDCGDLYCTLIVNSFKNKTRDE